ncbi:MAG: hypothetical protein AB7S70_03665 [Hyphomicrobium sp.]
MEADDIDAAVRTALADVKAVREVKMIGGIGFMLNGNMLVVASERGLSWRASERRPRPTLSPAPACG